MRMHLTLERAKVILERRLFLKAAGLGLAAPLAMHFARSATAQSTGAPKRLLIMYVPHGIPPEHFNPRMGGDGNDPTQFALDMTNESVLAPLEPYKQYVNVFLGMKYAAGEFGTHEGIVNVLSGTTFGDTTTPRTTVDQVIGKGLGVKPLILGACSHMTYGIDLHGMLFWDGTPIDPQKNPAAVADKLFGGLGTGPTVSADEQLRNAMLDLTAGEIQTLQTSVTGLTSEQTKLQVHLDAIKALKEGGGSGVSSCTTAPSLPTVEQVRKESAGIKVDSSNSNDYFYQEANFRTLLKAQLELTTQALICNAAQVIGLMPMYPTAEFNFSFIGGSAGNGSWAHHNGISHMQHQQSPTAMWNSPVSIENSKPDARPVFGRAQRWFYQQLVDNVVSVLAATPDPAASDGSKVLDNTLILVMSEIGEGAFHLRDSRIVSPQIPTYLPLVTIGKAGGAFNTGRVVNFPISDQAAMGRPAVDLYLTMAHAMGVPGATFPGTTGLITDVLT